VERQDGQNVVVAGDHRTRSRVRHRAPATGLGEPWARGAWWHASSGSYGALRAAEDRVMSRKRARAGGCRARCRQTMKARSAAASAAASQTRTRRSRVAEGVEGDVLEAG